jgi:hypothetical protein
MASLPYYDRGKITAWHYFIIIKPLYQQVVFFTFDEKSRGLAVERILSAGRNWRNIL